MRCNPFSHGGYDPVEARTLFRPISAGVAGDDPVDANILQPLIDVANSVLTFFYDNVYASWGLSIIFLTIVTRLAILPLSLKQIRSMRSLQAHQPEIKRIQERYKDDRQRHAARADGLLPREQDQPVRLVRARCCSSCRCSSPLF